MNSIGQEAKLMLDRISLLLWKNLLFRRRHFIVTALEILLPTLVAITIVSVRVGGRSAKANSVDSNTTFTLVTEEMALKTAADALNGEKTKFDYKGFVMAYVPDNNDAANKIMEKVKRRIPSTFGFEGFSTETDVEIHMAELRLPNKLSGGRDRRRVKTIIVFPADLKSDNFPQGYTISYKIRMVDTPELANTSALFPEFQTPGPDRGHVDIYNRVGFTGLQIVIEKELIQHLTGNYSTQTINSQAFPYPPYKTTPNFDTIYLILLPQFMVLGFIFIVPSIMRNVLSEKETGIKELMKLMGLPNWMHWLGWMLNSLMVLSFTVSIVTILFFVPFATDKGAVFTYTDYTLFWFVLFLYSIAATSFCFFVSTFFKHATTGTTAGIVLWLLTYYIPVNSMERNYQFLGLGPKITSAILPNTACHWVLKIIGSFEGKSVGARWSNIAESPSYTTQLSVVHCCLMLILDTILYLALTIYCENVIPSDFGIRKPWDYPFHATIWRRAPKNNRVTPTQIEESEDRPGFEEEPMGLSAGIVIKDLKKVFGRNKVAVNMVGTFKMFDGQITAFLGHNGAGKTTTLSMLTGLFSPTSGTATVNGFDIATDMDSVRKNLGLCPQHNMLFEKLTVGEHLIFFGRLKGLSKSAAKKEITSLLPKLHLTEKEDSLAEDVSGGQKRKLSLGIALIGGTKVVILDEPTSGMDPEARRAIWDLLLGMRGERTIVLTTHFMEEADVLGDRIAIMKDGKVRCCGSPMFLKKFYGAGYTLELTVIDPEIVDSVLEIVQKHIPAAFIQHRRKKKYRRREVAITIPNESDTNAEFPRLFTTLSDRKEELGILTVGLSLATMDDILVKVGEEILIPGPAPGIVTDEYESKATFDIGVWNERRMTGFRLILHQFIGLFRKRIIYTLRKWTLFISQAFIPIGLLITCILLSNWSLSPNITPPPLKMDLASYKNPVTLFRASPPSLGDAYRKVVGSSAKSTSRNLGERLLEIGINDIGEYREQYIVAGDLNQDSLTAMFSSITFHASPLSVNLMSNTILRSMPGWKGYSIQVTSHPIQSGMTFLEIANPGSVSSVLVQILFGTLLPLGLALFAASFIVFPVEEKLCKAKQLQMMTGVSPVVYWGSSFLWDFCITFLLICLMLTCFPIFQKYSAFTAYQGAGVIFLILVIFGFSAISFSYLFSTFVATVPGGFSLVTIIHILTGMFLPLLAFMMEILFRADTFLFKFIRGIGKLFPAFGASISIMRFTTISTKNSRCNMIPEAVKKLICDPNSNIRGAFRQCCSNCLSLGSTDDPVSCFKPEPYLVWKYDKGIELPDLPPGVTLSPGVTLPSDDGNSIPGIAQDLMYLFLIGLVYKALLMIIEYGLVGKIKARIFKSNPPIFQVLQPEDEDVLIENQRVAGMVTTGRAAEDALIVENFCKSYGSFAAVTGLSFGVHYGECFGLLGVNGAGKTTTFRMLTGDEYRSVGNAFGNCWTLEGNRTKFLTLIGYCPQFDGIVGVLTGIEMLQLFCRLRGVEDEEAGKWLEKLGLDEAKNVQCKKYSGGMKRRLCAAIALVGDPPIILMDEPTTGVDPIARRQFWKVILSVRDAGQAVVLTSHSMEECEALCSRLGIMVNGQFQCLGGVQHLKNKYAQGFRLMIKLKMTSADEVTLTDLSARIEKEFSPCTLKDKHQNILEYQLTNTEISWGQLFQTMEDLRGGYPELIEDYSVSETTLEEVFLSFARNQYPEREVNVTYFKKLVTCQRCK